MAKFNNNSQQSGDDDGSWLMSYADMMTLIACFFILLIAFANFDPVGFTQKTQEIAKHFNKDKFKSSQTPMEIMQEEVATHPELVTKAKVSVKNGELLITFSGSTLFEGESHLLTDDAVVTIDTMIDIIKSKNPNYRILVEGHTDNQRPSAQSQFTSNWALSGARSASVIERFEYFGFDPQTIIPIGLADTKPLLPNEDDEGKKIEENMAINRRVVVKVLEPINEADRIRLGLGVYFQDATE